MTDTQKSAHIKDVLLKAGVELRQQYPILMHQDAIGAGILAFALLGMFGTAYLFYLGLVSAWLCIPVVALFASLTHELEHDLIHLMYFKNRPWAHHLMLALVWLARPSTISPWTRRRMHLHHHKHSGTDTDLEEQGITNGEPWGLKRLLMMSDQMLSIYLRPIRMRKLATRFIRAQQPKSTAERWQLVREQIFGYIPLGYIYYTLWHGFLIYHAVALTAQWSGAPLQLSPLMQQAVTVVNFLAVTWLAPNALRMFCLHFVSSNMHYYGDVEDKNIMQQCQVLNAWWMLPFNLFCFNFGSTHAIHHFLVKEPFYVRQLTAKTGHRVMREMGVRFNDSGTFRRDNRFGPEPVLTVSA